jgi:FkbM family methyltransferase
MLSSFKNLIFNLMGRRNIYRLGRAMYLHARGDIANDMSRNGEILIQNGVLSGWRAGPAENYKLVIFDVGANIGEWSAALLGQLKAHAIDERVDLFSFEPVPATAKTLRGNLPGNLPCLHIEELALSSSVGTAEIYVAAANAGTNSLHDDPANAHQTTVTIALTTAVDFCETRAIQHVHLLKCDTEGHDMEVIRGALPLLKEERLSVLQFEYNHRWVFSRNFLSDVFDAVKSMPYKVAKLQADHVLVFEKWHPKLDKFFEGNYALIHHDALEWFPTKAATFDRFNTLVAT